MAAVRRLANLFRSVLTAFLEEWRVALASIGPTVALLVSLTRIPEDKQVALLGRNGPIFVAGMEIALGVLVLGLVGWFFVKGTRRLAQPDPVPPIRAGDYKCRIIEDPDEARHVNVDLVPKVFKGVRPPRDGGAAAQRKNSRRIIGLVDARTNEIVGWASLWPINEEVGSALEGGDRNDDDLTADDLLPQSDNQLAPYLLLRAFAVLAPYRNDLHAALMLGQFVLFHVIDEFLGTSDRSIRIVAIAYSEEGERLCRYLLLKRNGCYADFGKRGKKPIFVRSVTRQDVYQRLRGA